MSLRRGAVFPQTWDAVEIQKRVYDPDTPEGCFLQKYLCEREQRDHIPLTYQKSIVYGQIYEVWFWHNKYVYILNLKKCFCIVTTGIVFDFVEGSSALDEYHK